MVFHLNHLFAEIGKLLERQLLVNSTQYAKMPANLLLNFAPAKVLHFFELYKRFEKSCKSFLTLLSVISRLSLGEIRQGIRKGKETAILTNSTFSVWEFLRCSFVHPWFIVGLLYEGDREGTRDWNLNKSHFLETKKTRVSSSFSISCLYLTGAMPRSNSVAV